MRRLLIAIASTTLLGCGGGGSSTSTAPTQTTVAPVNRAPTITAMTMTGFGMQDLSTFTFTANASDPDGDSISYVWDIAGSAATGTSGTIRFSSGGNGTARVTVSDGKGATATDTRPFIVGSMTGRWTGVWAGWQMTSNLVQQSGGLVTGDYIDQLGVGRLDPAVANTVDINGNIRLRYKSSVFSDFLFTGTMDQTGRRITGVVNGSGYNNYPFTINK